MTNKTFTRLGAVLLAMAMLFTLAACGAPSYSFEEYGSGDLNATTPPYTLREPGSSLKDKEPLIPTKTTEPATEAPTTAPQVEELSDPNLKYVMIYNPKIYDENSYLDYSSMAVGTLGSQVDPQGNRAEGLEKEPEFTFISQNDWLQQFPATGDLEGNRSEAMGRSYSQGQVRTFLAGSDIGSRPAKEFVCAYAGQYCYIWIPNMGADLTTAAAAAGREFDQNIYQNLVNTFGQPRFVGDVGKVNLLCYDMGTSLLGYFCYAELLTNAELTALGIDCDILNTGDALVHINSNYLNTGVAAYDAVAYSTMAHEFQHLLNFTAAVESVSFTKMNTWLNEGFSGYIEAELYPGVKDINGQLESFRDSDLIRNGQSLYNFDTNYGDIGVYGSVYYFTKYLEKIAGKNIFSDVTEYWRESYSTTLTTAEALAKSVPASVYNTVDNNVDYSSLGITFNSKEEEWMSKLTLNFYVAMLSNGENISVFNDIDREALLYDSIDGANIEGGGRIIVALNDTTFKIPEGSDSGLIYVGLDANFQPIMIQG